MSDSYLITCDGHVTTNQDGTASCSQAWTLVERQDVVFSIEDLDHEVLGVMFMSGFVLYATFWGVGRGVRAVLSMIR